MGSLRCRSHRGNTWLKATCFVPLATSNLLHRYKMKTSELVNGYIGSRRSVEQCICEWRFQRV
ncbi:hypothetical protein TorRG33x02_236700 [Trema orientale]|uniref:Uncharacterized protein n=1 Tax=Trema orientale TaxID=63057 RepID=A0A2P5E0W0_TREOI|nr:hypothetical protein TorRG33x02_236700 [Trema orientale]